MLGYFSDVFGLPYRLASLLIYMYIVYVCICIYIYIYIYKQLNRDLLNESFHVCAEHSTIIRSITPE